MRDRPYRFVIAGIEVLMRRSTSKEWNDHNPVLWPDEPGYDLDENKIKVGDGKTSWKDLPWFATIHKD